MNIQKDLPELIQAGIISEDTAERIRNYYVHRKISSSNRLMMIFGILGATLIGLGIILIIAHNWDELSRASKTFFSFLPLLLGQTLCAYVIAKKYKSIVWRESVSIFLFFGVGASISLLSQVYHISGNISSFLLTWLLLCAPIIYVMRSSVTSLLYLVGITYYAVESSYWTGLQIEGYLYWLLLLVALPHYYTLYRKKAESNLMTFHNWFLPLSVIICLGTLAYKAEELMFVAYCTLFSLLYLIGDADFMKHQKVRNNAYQILASVGTVVLLLILSFNWFWKELISKKRFAEEWLLAPEFYISLVLIAFTTALLYRKWRKGSSIQMISIHYLCFLFVFLLGMYSTISIIFINAILFILGLVTINKGVKQNHLGLVNYGLFVITALIVCRFFDTSIAFVLKGILFVLVGTGFFLTNYWMLKRRRTNEK